MKRRYILILLLVAAAVAPFMIFRNCDHVALAQVEYIPVNTLLDNSMSSFEQTESFDSSIEKFMRRWELKGASFALMRNDSLLYAKGYGAANDTTECDVNNLFRIASVSKLLTATAVMKLVEDGRLSLTSQVFGSEGILSDSLFLDLYTRNLEKVNVGHLMRHTAGFSRSYGDVAFNPSIVARVLDRPLPVTTDDIIRFTIRNPLRAQPGGRYDYSNVGYIILGKIVERVSGVSYEDYLRDSILAPIGCYDMHIGRNFAENHRVNEVQYYEVKEATPVEAYDGSGRMTMKSDGGNNVTLLGGAGGWVASPTELLLFIASINGCSVKSDILSQESIDLMTMDSDRLRPMGWAHINGEEWLRSGSMAGTTALIKRQRDGYTWVFVSNSSAWIGHKLSSYISSHISRAISRVDEWPARNLFEVAQAEVLPETEVETNVQEQ